MAASTPRAAAAPAQCPSEQGLLMGTVVGDLNPQVWEATRLQLQHSRGPGPGSAPSPPILQPHFPGFKDNSKLCVVVDSESHKSQKAHPPSSREESQVTEASLYYDCSL